MRVVIPVVTLLLLFVGASDAQVGRGAQREAARLERLAGNMWEGMLDDVSFGFAWDRERLLDVFNFANGARYLNQKLESGQAETPEVRGVVEMLLLQSHAVDRSLRSGKASRWLLRDWEEARAMLESLARQFGIQAGSLKRRRESTAARENVNNLKIEIKDVRHTGNFFGKDYRVRGVISGRNIVSVGFYHGDQLLKLIPIPLHERRYTESPFDTRIEVPRDPVTVRVIDSQGFVLEEALRISGGGTLPGLK